MNEVRDNAAEGRFELKENGMLAFAEYRREGDTVQLPYVEAAPGLRGTGAADRLMRGVVAMAERDGLKLVPLCGYARAWMRRNKVG
jgi:predicted GNAT family acetyltransferase